MSIATAPTQPGARFDDGELGELTQALAETYAIERELGRGGMGVVLLGRDLRLERSVAIKVLPRERAADPLHRQRFLREAKTAAKLSHPNIVPILHADEAGAFAYFTMAYVEGETLAERVRARGLPPREETVRVLREVAWALAYAHARGVVHRDIKPENILVERGGRVLVSDFGIAFDQQLSRMTDTDHVVGTAAFMSPEQIVERALDGRSDLYSLGVVGYWLLAGALPFQAATTPAMLVKQATEAAPPLRTVAPEVPAALAAVIDRCLAKEPEARFPSGEALAEALTAAEAELAGAPTRARAEPVLGEGEVSAVLQRAAQLQADAARRIEERSRVGATGVTATTASGLRLSEVQAAAAEAGISPEYVAIAAAELPAGRVPAVPSNIEGRWAARLFGRDVRQIEVSRVFRAPAKTVLQALAQVWQAAPYNLRLLDAVGPHPLDGGALLFRVPKFTYGGDGSVHVGFAYYMYILSIGQVRLTMRYRGHGEVECIATADLHGALASGRRYYTPVMLFFALLGGVGAGVPLFALTLPLFAALGAVAGSGAMFAGIHKLNHVGYGYYLRRAQEQLETLLADVDAHLKTQAMVDSLPAPRAALPRGEED